MTSGFDSKPLVAVVGYGRVGRVLVRAFVRAGYPVAGVAARRRPDDRRLNLFKWLNETGIKVAQRVAGLPDEVDFLVLCVGDSQIGGLAEEIIARDGFKLGTVVAHTAGAISTKPLEPVRVCGCLPLAWHPLQTFTGDEGPELLEGVTFGIDGDPAAVDLGSRIARDLGGVPFRVPPELKTLYHLGGVFACNLMAALVGISQELFREVGMDEKRSLQAVGPLIEVTARNIARKGVMEAVTGPLKRGDDVTIASHLETLKNFPEAAAVYRLLSRSLLAQLTKDEDGSPHTSRLDELLADPD